MYVLTLAELSHSHFILKQLLHCFLLGIATYRDTMYFVVLPSRERKLQHPA